MEICQIVVAIFKSVPTAQHGSRAMLPDWLKYEKRIRWYNLGKKNIAIYVCVGRQGVCTGCVLARLSLSCAGVHTHDIDRLFNYMGGDFIYTHPKKRTERTLYA